MFTENNTKKTDFKHQVWAKFEGNGDERIPGDVELLNLPRKDCISLDQVHDALGNRTYVTTLDKDELTNLALVRCRRSHLRLTIDAMEYIDNEIDKLAKVYGFVSNIEPRRK